MLLRSILTSIFLIGGMHIALAADPVGHYTVIGQNPGGEGANYTGTVEVTKTGDTYKVVWMIGDVRFIGTAIGNKEFLAISYKSGNGTGLALYATDGENWKGAWTYANGTTLGTERWTRDEDGQ
jgi:hypothetical protein